MKKTDSYINRQLGIEIKFDEIFVTENALDDLLRENIILRELYKSLRNRNERYIGNPLPLPTYSPVDNLFTDTPIDTTPVHRTCMIYREFIDSLKEQNDQLKLDINNRIRVLWDLNNN